MKNSPDPSQHSRTQLNSIHPIDITPRQGTAEPGMYCLEIISNSTSHHPVIWVWFISETDAERVRVTRIPFNSVLKYYQMHLGVAQDFRCFDDAGNRLPFTIVKIRNRTPMAEIVAEDGWGTRSCPH